MYPAPQSKDDKMLFNGDAVRPNRACWIAICACADTCDREKNRRDLAKKIQLHLLGWRPTGIRLIAIDVEGSLQLGVTGLVDYDQSTVLVARVSPRRTRRDAHNSSRPALILLSLNLAE